MAPVRPPSIPDCFVSSNVFRLSIFNAYLSATACHSIGMGLGPKVE